MNPHRLTSSWSGPSCGVTCAPRARLRYCARAARMTPQRAAAQLHVRRHSVRTVPSMVLFAVLAACRASLPDANGYLRVARVTGCGTPVTTGPLQIKNVLVGEQLSDSLLRMLASHEVDSPHCWYE